jgi:hypothetical protein
MLANPNALQWDGKPGHYEVYYLTVTDPHSGVGLWIRYTMVAPLPGSGAPTTCSLWFIAMDPRDTDNPRFARKATFPIDQLVAQADPFRLSIDAASLTNEGMVGAFEDVTWELRWNGGRAYEHVHPALRAARVASTILVLPHADVAVHGTVTFAGRRLELEGARAGQAHLWGSKHAASWAWAHSNDFTTLDGEPVADVFVDGVSVIVPRFGRQVGPSTPVVGRVQGQDFRSISPLRVLANDSTFALTRWRFEARAGNRKLVGEVNADRELLVGVTYHDPDGELAYCYNSETASMRLELWQRDRRASQWEHRTTLVSPGRAHFEYAQRSPLPDVGLMIQ